MFENDMFMVAVMKGKAGQNGHVGQNGHPLFKHYFTTKRPSNAQNVFIRVFYLK